MLVRTILAPMTVITFFIGGAFLAACGGGGGGAGGGNGGDGTTSGTTSGTDTGGSGTTSSTSGSTSSTTSAAKKCIDLCTELKKCPGLGGTDCAADCPPVDTFNTTSMCGDEYVAEIECILGDADPCTAGDVGGACNGAVGAYVQCSDNYCAANPATPGCM